MSANAPFHAAARFGLGGSKKDLAAIGSKPDDWVMAQLDTDAAVTMEGIPRASAEVAAYLDFARQNRSTRKSGNTDIEAFKKRQRAWREARRKILLDELTSRFKQSVTTRYPVKERLALFWSNHFTVSWATKPQIAAVCTSFENEAIRPSLDGYFADMLKRVVMHPAMLMYLDNFHSVGPESPVGVRRKLGINENLGRELMELHTLGVDGGYTQHDVRSLAKILTGWTIGNRRLARFGVTPGTFAFVPYMHQPGPQTLLGKVYDQPDVTQGLAALDDLAHHPSTAHHIAVKLVRHFVSDQPEPRDVRQVADIFIDTGGHLPSVHRAVISLPSAWQGNTRKLKTPYELLVSTWRGLDLSLFDRRPIAGMLHSMNDLPFSAPSPAGWPDVAEYWAAPAIVKERVQWGVAVGRRLGNRISAVRAAQYMVDPGTSGLLLASIDGAESPGQGLALLIASPDFQWR